MVCPCGFFLSLLLCSFVVAISNCVMIAAYFSGLPHHCLSLSFVVVVVVVIVVIVIVCHCCLSLSLLFVVVIVCHRFFPLSL